MAQRDEVNSWFYIKLASELDCYLGLLISAYHLTIQWIFPTQELNRGLLHCKWTLYQLSY